MWRIGIVDDDEVILKELSSKISSTWRSVKVYTFSTAESFLESDEDLDLVVLDVMLPDGNGYELCELIKESNPKTRVVLLTVLGDDESVLKGFEVGADDYVVKPFNPDVLIARIKRFLERNKKNLYDFGDLKVDLSGGCVYVKGKRVYLPKREFETLVYLVENKGQVISRERLLEVVWGGEEVSPRAVDTAIKRLRKAIEEDPNKPRYIKTVWGIGYVFVGGEES